MVENCTLVFGFLSPEVVQFIDMRDANIVFLTSRKKTPGSTVKFRFALPETKTQKVDLSLRIASSRPSGGSHGHICVGMAALTEEKLADLEGLLRTYGQRADLGLAGRRSQRLPISLRVMSRELPGFGAVTVDISQHGVRLLCQGLLKAGMETRLTVESDTASVENMVLKVRAVWSSENTETKGYLAGLEFIELNPTQTDALERYCKSLAGRLRGDVMHRQIADGEIVARPNTNADEALQLPAKILPKGPPPPPGGLPKGPPPPPPR